MDPPDNGGPPCSRMALGPADPERPGYRNASWPSWGGHPIKWTHGPGADQRWHLFTPQFANECNVDKWINSSFVVHAVGDSPVGPWSYSEVTLPPFSHGPQAVLDPVTSEWVLYFVGGWNTKASSWPNCSMPSSRPYPTPARGPGLPGTPDGCGPRTNAGCGLRMAVSTSPFGPWEIHEIKVSNGNQSLPLGCDRADAAPYVLPNRSVVVAFGAGGCQGGLETIGVMRADTWRGPYALTSLEPIASADGCPTAQLAEDPAIWHDGRRGWHLIAHGLCDWRVPGHNGTDLYGLHAYSRDAVNWTVARDPATGFPTLPWSKTVAWTNGSETYISRMERPQVVLDPETRTQPLYLATAVCPGGFSVGGAACNGLPSWGLYRPIVRRGRV